MYLWLLSRMSCPLGTDLPCHAIFVFSQKNSEYGTCWNGYQSPDQHFRFGDALIAPNNFGGKMQICLGVVGLTPKLYFVIRKDE